MQKLYVISISIAFVFLVGISFLSDTYKHGFSLESGHKLGHIALGIWGLWMWRRNKINLYKSFILTNVLLWGSFAVVGWLIPDFLGLAAFNRVDTILHTVVAGSGMVAMSAK